MNNKLIIVSGYCATGKSTFSHKLAQRLNIPCFNKDMIKEIMGDGLGPESGEVYTKGSRATFMLMLYIVERFMQADKVCILESNFKITEGEQIKILLDKYRCNCLTFNFLGDLDVLYDRYVARDREEKRHWVHKSAGDDREAFKNVQLRFGQLSLGQTINTDATLFEKVDYDSLFTVAREFIK